MATVHYQHEFPYTYVEEYNDYFPILTLRITNPFQPEQSLDIDGYLDSGAKRSFFDGWIATTLVSIYSADQRLHTGHPQASKQQAIFIRFASSILLSGVSILR